MIQIRPKQAPADFLNAPMRHKELDELRRWLNLPPTERGAPPPSERRHRDVRNLLDWVAIEFSGKCAFCETKVDNRTGEVMFFRPVGRSGSQADGSVKYSYPWLAWDWSNLYLSCRDCFELRKSEFEVEAQHVVGNASDLDRENSGPYFSEEKPLLIDPRVEAPIGLLYFTEEGEIASRSGSRRGTYTIDCLRLNRPTLVQMRRQQAKRIKQLWLDARAETLDKSDSSAATIADLAKALCVECRPGAQFAGMKAYLLLEWMTGETKIALDSANVFATALRQEPWQCVHRTAMQTLSLVQTIDEYSQTTISTGDQLRDSPPIHTSATVMYISVRGDMYRIDTGGGAYVLGNIDTGGGSFIGRDNALVGRDQTIRGEHSNIETS